jgi:UDP-N-acetylmuramoyl-L-alanyl-D-glutamate--2,6-diaminopimelate ligase
MTESFGVGLEAIQKALANFHGVRGRVERVTIGGLKPDGSPKQTFEVIVDYAHTADSLSKLYETFQESRKICVLGSTGGGRDKWKRKDMGAVAEKFCDDIILTNEDPYDEAPMQIINDVKSGIKEKSVQIIIDRREAIRTAISLAETGDTVLITGKGTDPYIMGPNNTKLPWDDATVAREELTKLFEKKV